MLLDGSSPTPTAPPPTAGIKAALANIKENQNFNRFQPWGKWEQMRSSWSEITHRVKNNLCGRYIIAPSQLSSSLWSSHTHPGTVASSERQGFFVLVVVVMGGRGGGVFTSDQVSPKKEIPMEQRPKSWAAGCGQQGLDAVEEMLMWRRTRPQARQLVPDLVDILPSQREEGGGLRMRHYPHPFPVPAGSRSTFNPHP